MISPENKTKKKPNPKQMTRKQVEEKKQKLKQRQQDFLPFLLENYNLVESVIGRILPKYIGDLRICLLSRGTLSPHKNEN